MCLNSSPVLTKNVWIKEGCYIKINNLLDQNNYEDTWPIGTYYNKRCKGLLETSKYMKNLVTLLLMELTVT